MNMVCHLPPPLLSQLAVVCPIELAVVCPIAIGQSSPSAFSAVTTSHLWLNHSYHQCLQQYGFEGVGAFSPGAESHFGGSSWIDSGESSPTELLSPNFWCKLASPPASRCYRCWLVLMVLMVVLYSCYTSPQSLPASQRPLVCCTTTYLQHCAPAYSAPPPRICTTVQQHHVSHQAGLHQRHNGTLRCSFRYGAPMHINRNVQSGDISEKANGQHHPTHASAPG